jgi:hypothetical protein
VGKEIVAGLSKLAEQSKLSRHYQMLNLSQQGEASGE